MQRKARLKEGQAIVLFITESLTSNSASSILDASKAQHACNSTRGFCSQECVAPWGLLPQREKISRSRTKRKEKNTGPWSSAALGPWGLFFFVSDKTCQQPPTQVSNKKIPKSLSCLLRWGVAGRFCGNFGWDLRFLGLAYSEMKGTLNELEEQK